MFNLYYSYKEILGTKNIHRLHVVFVFKQFGFH